MPYVGIPGCERMMRNLMEVHGLKTSGPDGSTFRWSNARSQAGSCDSRRRVLRLSRPIAELWGPEGMRDTALHEVAHAIAGHKAGHGPEWKAVCQRIGAKPERCYTVTKNTPMPAARYTGTCPSGHAHTRQRAGRRPVSCGLCAPGGFDRRYMITWTENNG